MTDTATDHERGPSPGEGDDAPVGGRGRATKLLVAGALVLVALAIAFFVFGGDDDDAVDDAAPATSTPVPETLTQQLTPTGQALVDRLAAGRDSTFHATYRAEGGDDLTLEVWRKDGQVRQDSHLVSGDSTADTAGFLFDDGRAVTCSRRDGGEWTCADAVGTVTADGIFANLIAELAGADIESTDETIDGRAATCYRFDAADGAGEMCVDDDGIPVRAAVGPSTLVLETIDDDVPDDVFEPPAASTSAE